MPSSTSPAGHLPPSFCLDDHRFSPTELLICSVETKNKHTLLYNDTHFESDVCIMETGESKIVLLPILSASQLGPVYSSEHSQEKWREVLLVASEQIPSFLQGFGIHGPPGKKEGEILQTLR